MGSVTGNAPQPGETPRNEGEPWSYTDPGAPWWRVSPDRDPGQPLIEAAARRHRRPPTPVTDGSEPAFAPEALDAHAAGVQDATEAINPQTADGYAESAPQPELLDLSDDTPGVPDIMVLPEPLRDRPTVALDRGPGPTDSGFAPRSRTRSQATPGVLDPDRAAQIENSRFWLTDEERAAAGAAWPISEPRDGLTTSPGPDEALRGKPPAHRSRAPHRTVPGLISLIALGLIAAFFAWVSAEPFWLAVGHGEPGAATVSQCTGSGVTQRCSGSFAAAGFTVPRVTLLGVDATVRDAAGPAPARMVGPGSRHAYVGASGPLIHLRWTLGFVLVLLCGYGIAALTGARRLETRPARRAAILVSLAGPFLLLVGFLAAGY
jgi:hypothetical protein